MKLVFLKLAISIMGLFFIYGCTHNKNVEQLIENEPDTYHKTESSYYYFTESQLEKNKGNLDKAIVLLENAIEVDSESLYLQRELAILYAQQKDSQNALRVLENILAKEPNDIETLFLYGKVKHGLKDFDAAKKVYTKIIDLDKQQKDVYLLLGGIYLKEDDTANALKVFGQLVQNFPTSYSGHFFLGRIYAKQGNTREAETEFKKAMDLEPDFVEPRFELLNIYKKQGSKENILKLYEDILEKHPNNIQAAFELGYIYHQNGKVTEAEEIFYELGTRSVYEFEVILKVIQLYLDTKNYKDAVVILEGMLKGAPNSSDLHYLTGVAYYGYEDQKKALMEFKKVKPDSRFFQDAAVHISFIYQEKGQLDEAITFLKDVIKEQPENPEFMYYLGTVYEEGKKFKEAEIYLKQAINIEPQEAKFHFRLGVVYDKWGRKDDSMESMKTTIRLDPKHAHALNYLGYTYADLGVNLDEAERLIKEALKYKPDDGYITDSLGWVYFKKGRYQEAIILLKKAVQLVPDDPIMLEHLGDAYLKTNDKKNALKFYKRSLSNKKNDKGDLEKKIQNLLEKGH
jgi:tetratricopeptide (TPR) repeat protein